ncbi:MAG: hypothetical protein BWZ03_00300 [bacterium ADurb.BinA186]|nr:MAG: hypothetical protein BWZ03_00300 [bacterium ADurb.BinA186]
MSDGDKEEKKQSMISVGDSSMDREPRKEETIEKKMSNQIKASNPDF